MLPGEAWDKNPDITSILEPMIMEHLKGNRDAYTAEQIINDMNLLEQIPFNNIKPMHVLKCIENTLQNLEEEEQLQSKGVPIGNSIEWFYRPIN